MKKLLGKSLKLYLKTRYNFIQSWIDNPLDTQKRLFNMIIHQTEHTQFGRDHQFNRIKSIADFRKQVPIRDYDGLYPYIDRMLMGERNVLWPTLVTHFAKSSGTSGAKSKHLPVTKRFLKENLTKGSWDTMSMLYHNHKDVDILSYKSLIIGGSLQPYQRHNPTVVGDVSAIMLTFMPMVSRPFYTPDIETATMSKWEEKLNRIAEITSKQPDIGMISGVPTWNMVLFNMILNLTGKNSMSEVWPDFNTYIHGGVNFGPYRSQFQSYFPDRELIYHEVYNASEGYISTQYSALDKSMLLLLDNGIFFEFVPIQDIESEDPVVLSLGEVERDQVYSILLTSTSGLFRYELGDTIRFVSLKPYLIEVVGRTKAYINAFGEELMIHNAEQALTKTCAHHKAEIKDYTAAPKFLQNESQGRHDWLIEFITEPECIDDFADSLDSNLQKLNSDYAAKRYKSMALERLQIQTLTSGTFEKWLQQKGRLTAQTKVPRLANNRQYVDDIIRFCTNQ